ncbi:hypothetical protein HU200_025791 [Digitaria exilis]|uniref:F-box/LRR-repeat protein 15/At3g58940/PEG3-like LRR domain-containing protein n=1 Tax=Digitaria exilis TaxID=1010633 RepID=A0A835BXD0_9POAL|nr:hypothetical protein HU200_025791 [Digitaria exilis]
MAIVSDLPPEVLDLILVRLPLRDAARSSVLSVAWGHSWRQLSDLDFTSSTCDRGAIDAVLLSHSGSVRHVRLEVTVTDGHLPHVQAWVDALSKKMLQSLKLSFNAPSVPSVLMEGQVPKSMLACGTLTELVLTRCVLPPIPASFTGLFPSLTELCLTCCTFENGSNLGAWLARNEMKSRICGARQKDAFCIWADRPKPRQPIAPLEALIGMPKKLEVLWLRAIRLRMESSRFLEIQGHGNIKWVAARLPRLAHAYFNQAHRDSAANILRGMASSVQKLEHNYYGLGGPVKTGPGRAGLRAEATAEARACGPGLGRAGLQAEVTAQARYQVIFDGVVVRPISLLLPPSLPPTPPKLSSPARACASALRAAAAPSAPPLLGHPRPPPATAASSQLRSIPIRGRRILVSCSEVAMASSSSRPCSDEELQKARDDLRRLMEQGINEEEVNNGSSKGDKKKKKLIRLPPDVADFLFNYKCTPLPEQGPMPALLEEKNKELCDDLRTACSMAEAITRHCDHNISILQDELRREVETKGFLTYETTGDEAVDGFFSAMASQQGGPRGGGRRRHRPGVMKGNAISHPTRLAFLPTRLHHKALPSKKKKPTSDVIFPQVPIELRSWKIQEGCSRMLAKRVALDLGGSAWLPDTAAGAAPGHNGEGPRSAARPLPATGLLHAPQPKRAPSWSSSSLPVLLVVLVQVVDVMPSKSCLDLLLRPVLVLVNLPVSGKLEHLAEVLVSVLRRIEGGAH